MNFAKKTWSRPATRPVLLLVVVILVLTALDGAHARVLTAATAYSVLQQFATLGPLALALGLTMIVREFDLSIGGGMSLAGCIAVMAGGSSPALGLCLALAVGCATGLCQALLMQRLHLSSIAVTLGGLLVLSGAAYVLTGNETIGYERMDVANAVNARVGGVFSMRSLIAVALFVVAEFVMSWTRLGRDVMAVGSNRRAALLAGVRVSAVLAGVMALAGALTAATGALLSFSLAAASPVALADTLVPATAAAIIGGVPLAGGRGRPLGIAAGVLVLCVLRSGLTAIGVPPFVHSLASGAVLLAVALIDSEDLARRLYPWGARPTQPRTRREI